MFQEDPETYKGPMPSNNTKNFLLKGPFQSQHIEIAHIPTMVDRELEFGEYSRDQEQSRNDK